MPKGKKICPECKVEQGVRCHECVCGYKFGSLSVPASGQSMVLEPIDKRIAESVGNVRDIISKVENRPSSKFLAAADIEAKTPITVGATIGRKLLGGGVVVTPAGECPIKPKGYKENWPDGPASDEVIQKWAQDVYEYGEGRYAIEAVVYFARYFWDINGKEFQRLHDLIVAALKS